MPPSYLHTLVLVLLFPLNSYCYVEFGSIFSIHTYTSPKCPPSYTIDDRLIGCCGQSSQTVTEASGPDRQFSEGCCTSGETCTGVIPSFYDWTMKDNRVMVILSDGKPISTENADATQTRTSSGTILISTSAQPVETSSQAQFTGSMPKPSSQPPQPTNTAGRGDQFCTGDGSCHYNDPGPNLKPGEIAGIVMGVVAAITGFVGVWYAKRQYDHSRRKRAVAVSNQPGELPTTQGEQAYYQYQPYVRE